MHDRLAAIPGDLLLLVIGLATGAATLFGGSLALRFRSHIQLILGFSAGAVIGVALFDLLPEALQLAGPGRAPIQVMAVVAAGFAAYMALDRALKAAAASPILAGQIGPASLTVHSLMDGIGIGLAFEISPAIGAVVAAAVLAHDFSDGVNTVNLSLAGGGRTGVARRWLIADAAAPLVGIGLTRLFSVSEASLGLLIAGFTGVFLYIGASELVPTSHRALPRAWTSLATALGMALIYAAVRLAG